MPSVLAVRVPRCVPAPRTRAVEVPSSWDSTLGINLIVEALIAEVQAQRWDKAKDRIEALEGMFKATRLFRK